MSNQKIFKSRPKRTTCTFCNLIVNKKNIKKHIERRHSSVNADVTANHHLPSQCIDRNNGIFAVGRTFSGFSNPIHVQKCTWGNKHHVSCELEQCKRAAEFTRRSGLMGFQCIHVKSISYCPISSEPDITLKEEVLSDMVKRKWISENTKKICLVRKQKAESESCPLSQEVSLGNGTSKICVSVLETSISYYSRLGRVIVCFDKKRNTWHCPCSKPRNSCPHKSIAKWHLNQTQPELFLKVRSTDSDVFDIFVESGPQDIHSTEKMILYPPEKKDLNTMVLYLLNNKKLPAVLPKDLCSPQNMETLPKHLIPIETFCTVCPGKIPLSDPILISQKAKIVTFTGILEDVTTYCKRCGLCGHFYRYQEWAEGLHNFDDHTILTLHLCTFLRQSVQNHTAVGRALDILEQTNQKKYPNHDSILHGYLHFEALTEHNYNFSCVHCGIHPPVVIMDLHKKGVFSMPVSDIEDPPPQFEGHVDIEEFWQSVDQEIVCRGFLQSNRENPCKVSPSYVKWAPWIGPLTRASKKVLNTEYAKLTAKKSVVEQADIDISEERLSSELMNLKVDALRKLVKECGVDSKGSKMDLLLRLREEMKTRSTYDKVFQKVWGASGGWAVIMCPCGIVNSVKFNIRAESPRDYADMLLSFKHFPNVVIYDFARGLVTHTNFREPERLPFSPFEGRVAAATPENIASAKRGELKINLSWLQIKKDPPDLNGHPATGSAEHYALYDTFHQYNTKDEKDALRLIGLVPELCGWVNSQIVEQLFSGMRKNNYFMNSLSPASHIFLMRNILHHHNEKVNQQALEDLKRVSHGDVTLDAHGKATLVHVNIPKDVDMADHCGEQCEALTMTSNLMPCRASWTLGVHHPLQEQLVNYVLDEDRPMNELIVKDGQTCLTRENFVSLGLRREMDSMVGNACFRLIKEIFQHQGKDVYIVDLHIPPTWLLPSSCDPFLCLPLDPQKKDALIFPLWTPGHFLLCVCCTAHCLWTIDRINRPGC
ncbi:hypothetical protein PO909_010746 [Leuciscus waleckii]